MTTNIYDNLYNPDMFATPMWTFPGTSPYPAFAATGDGGSDAGDDSDDSDELDNVDFDAEDDDADDAEDSEGEDSEDDDEKPKDTGSHKAKSRAELEAELKRTQTNMSRARAQQRKWRERAMAAEKTGKDKIATPADVAAIKKAQKDSGDDAAQDEGKERGLTRADIEDILKEAEERAVKTATSRYKPVAVRAAAKNALTDAGLRTGKTVEERDRAFNRAYKLLDMDQIDVDPEDGEVMGLEEQIDELREEWPELFGEDEEDEPAKTVRRRPRINGKSGRAAEPGKQKITTSDGQLAHLRGHTSS